MVIVRGIGLSSNSFSPHSWGLQPAPFLGRPSRGVDQAPARTPSLVLITIDTVGAWKFDHIIAGHGPVQHGRDRMSQFRNYIEDLTARIERAKKAGTPLAELQKIISPASLSTLQSGGFGAFVADNLDKYTVYLGDRSPLEDRLIANISAIYNNLDRV